MQTITSSDNTKFKHVRALLEQARYRKKSAETVLEGVHLLESYLKKRLTPKQVWLSQQASAHSEVIPLLEHCVAVPTFELPDSLYKQLRSIGEGIDVLAVIELPSFELPDITTDTLILNDVQDTGNVGTLLRTAAAVGMTDIICTAGTASCWSPKCLRAGMGAQFSLSIYENVAINDVLNHVNVPLLATSSHTDELIYSHNLTEPVAWVMGNEGQGVCSALMEKASPTALPQPNGEESLNVAVAGALCMYEMLRQRNYN